MEFFCDLYEFKIIIYKKQHVTQNLQIPDSFADTFDVFLGRYFNFQLKI